MCDSNEMNFGVGILEYFVSFGGCIAAYACHFYK